MQAEKGSRGGDIDEQGAIRVAGKYVLAVNPGSDSIAVFEKTSRGLVPIQLEPKGLMDGLRELAARTDDLNGIMCAFKCKQPVEIADSLTATHLYRIAQEAIANALKHGHLKHILYYARIRGRPSGSPSRRQR